MESALVDTSTAVKALADAGVIGFLLFILILFIRGDIVTAKTMQKILDEAENRTAAIVNEFRIAVKDAVKEGILQAKDFIRDDTKPVKRSGR